MKFGLSDDCYQKIKAIVTKYSKYQFKLFGSRAKGNFKPNSDIDIAIEGKIDEKEKFQIQNDFDLLDIPYMIDLVFVQDIVKTEFLKSIQKEGVKF